MVRTSACHAEGREFESRRSRHYIDAASGVFFYGHTFMRYLSLTLLAIYDILVEMIVLLFSPIIIPILARYSYLRALFPAKHPNADILFHCASVGEINALKPLIRTFISQHPKKRVHITCTTTNALKIARDLDPNIAASLSVLDTFCLRYRELSYIKPKLICVMETEIWINQLLLARLRGIPVIFLNARMSEATLRYYQILKPFLEIVKPTVKAILCQSEADRRRFDRVFGDLGRYAGNLKYALSLPDYDTALVKAKYDYKQGDTIIVMGSSRPGEEKLILDAYAHLRGRYPQLKLVIALRHPQRLREVQAILGDSVYSLESSGEKHEDIHIIDTIGVLTEAYSIADISIVGGSLYDFGGHNPLEPAYYGNAIIMGSYHSSCTDSVTKLLGAGAILISDANSLEADLEQLINDQEKRVAMGVAARGVLERYKESLQIHMKEIDKWIE